MSQCGNWWNQKVWVEYPEILAFPNVDPLTRRMFFYPLSFFFKAPGVIHASQTAKKNNHKLSDADSTY